VCLTCLVHFSAFHSCSLSIILCRVQNRLLVTRLRLPNLDKGIGALSCAKHIYDLCISTSLIRHNDEAKAAIIRKDLFTSCLINIKIVIFTYLLVLLILQTLLE
jgi:hypothetical protein